ncbi:hypothetical protein GCM10010277_53410 [Streptomyces longisporoflavus]|nr:hypothetical protein GCM10010277_53410 [Streptomyces longisporoflavus]
MQLTHSQITELTLCQEQGGRSWGLPFGGAWAFRSGLAVPGGPGVLLPLPGGGGVGRGITGHGGWVRVGQGVGGRVFAIAFAIFSASRAISRSIPLMGFVKPVK